MKIAPIIAIVSMVAAAPCFASTLFSTSLSTGDGGPADRVITDSAGALVANGYAGTGTFSISNDAVAALVAQNQFATLFQSFSAIATDNFVTGFGSANGGTAAPGIYLMNSDSFDPTPLIGKTFYTFISNGTNPATGADQWALISYTVQITADPSTPPPNGYNLFASDGTVVFGKVGGTADSALGSGTSTIALQPVPEASAAILGLLGVAGLVRRRR